jgi:hypothetical protein
VDVSSFNPFEVFRHKSVMKVIFGVIGVVVMLTFVLSSGGGGGDFFNQIGQIFESRKGGSTIAKAYGNRITEGDLIELRRQRGAANAFMLSALNESYRAKAAELAELAKGSKLSPTTKEVVGPLIEARENSTKSREGASAYVAMVNQPLTLQRMQMARARALPDSEDQRALDTLQQLLRQDFSPIQQFFLPELPIKDERDLIDFQLLLDKADQLGIHYSKDAIRELEEQDLGGIRLTKDQISRIESGLRERHPGLTHTWLTEAIGNEYRARAAWKAIVGGDNSLRSMFPGVSAVASANPGTVTPAQFFDFYRENCSENDFTLLELDAKDFLDKVTEKPTEKELITLFDRYRNAEANPAIERPGFKEPRKLKLEFTTMSAKDPRIEKGIQQVKAASLLLSGVAAPMSLIGGNGVTALTQLAQPSLADSLPVKGQIAEFIKEQFAPMGPLDQFLFTPRAYNLYRAEPIATALAALTGVTSWTNVPVAVSLVTANVSRDYQLKHLPMVVQGIIAPAMPIPGGLASDFATLGNVALAVALTPKSAPEGVFAAEIRQELSAKQRRILFESDLNAFRDKLNEMTKDLRGPKPDKAKADVAKKETLAYVAKWLAERGLKAQGSEKPIDRYSVATDPNLKALNEKATANPDGTNSLVNAFFDSPPLPPNLASMPQFANMQLPPPSVFTPEWFPNPQLMAAELDKPNSLVWIAEELTIPPYTSWTNAQNLTNGDMAKRVEGAWKLEKARDLARKAADKLAEEVKAIAKDAPTNPTGFAKQLKDLAVQAKAKEVKLEGLASLKFDHGTTPNLATYSTPSIDRKLITYPTPNFATLLLEMQTKPLGSVKVVHDEPRERYYVAALTNRLDKSVDQFRDVFIRTASTNPQPNALYREHALLPELERNYREARERLRAEANLTETDEFKKSVANNANR